MSKVIITSGATYVDIDAVACAFLYKDLLSAKGIDSEIVFPGPINSSVTKTMFDWGINITKELSDDNVRFVVVDISEKSKFPKFVSDEKIDVIYDHRLMFMDDWKGKNIRLVIEEVGACATLIWEEIKNQGLENKVSKLSAKLTYTAIFSNTLNFNAGVTTERDRKAFNEIQKISGLNEDWIEKYYQESEREIFNDVKESIKNDTKLTEILGISKSVAIGQMELWNSMDFVRKNKEIIKETLLNISPVWFMTAPSISEGINYIYSENLDVKNILSAKIGAKFDGDIGVTNKLWLRKEILKKILE